MTGGPAPAGAATARLRAAAVALLMLTASAGAVDDATRAQLEQRIKLASRLIADPPAVQRIGASGNTQAQASFEESRVHLAIAEDLLAKRDLRGAQREVGEALRLITAARRMVPDAQAGIAAARQLNERKNAQLLPLIDAWRERIVAGSQDESELLGAIGLVEVARGATQQGRHDEALELLDRAQQQVLAGLTRLLHASTLDYTMRPANPAEEFEIELARHRSLVDLLPLALDQLKPGRDASALMARYHAASQTLLAQAIQQYESANLSRALVHLRDATSQLQRALAAAGVATPVPTSNTP